MCPLSRVCPFPLQYRAGLTQDLRSGLGVATFRLLPLNPKAQVLDFVKEAAFVAVLIFRGQIVTGCKRLKEEQRLGQVAQPEAGESFPIVGVGVESRCRMKVSQGCEEFSGVFERFPVDGAPRLQKQPLLFLSAN